MLLIHASNIIKEYRHREILRIRDLKIYDTDRIGIVGVNGVGKTTLMDILADKSDLKRGRVDIKCNISYIPQLEDGDIDNLNGEMKKRLKVNDLDDNHLSGGERTRLKIAEALSSNPHIIFADEPTASLDYNGVNFLKESLNDFKGALLLVSHDRDFLDSLCNKIIEVHDGRIKIYNGNYSHYTRQKEEIFENQLRQHKRYNEEKMKLEDLKSRLLEENKKFIKKSKGYFRIKSRSKKHPEKIIKRRLDKIKSLEKRFVRKEVPREIEKREDINISFDGSSKNRKIQVEGKSIYKSFGKRIIFNNASFYIRSGSKIGLLGENGSGKTTLLKMILNKEDGIEYRDNLKIAYFSQNFDELNDEDTILQNVTSGNELLYQRARDILGNLLIKEDEVFKKVKVLSGGERVKVSLTKILLGNMDILILDEPTNYLDIPSLEVLEKALKSYNGTVIFVSHDKRFLSSIVTEVLEIKNRKLIHYPGTFDEYLNHKKLLKESSKKQITEKIMVLENRATITISKLCFERNKDEKQRLNEEYQEMINKIKVLKNM